MHWTMKKEWYRVGSPGYTRKSPPNLTPLVTYNPNVQKCLKAAYFNLSLAVLGCSQTTGSKRGGIGWVFWDVEGVSEDWSSCSPHKQGWALFEESGLTNGFTLKDCTNMEVAVKGWIRLFTSSRIFSRFSGSTESPESGKVRNCLFLHSIVDKY